MVSPIRTSTQESSDSCVDFRIAQSRRGPRSSGIEMELSGDDPAVLELVGHEIADRVATLDGIQDVDLSLESGDDEVRLSVDRERAAQAGFDWTELSGVMDKFAEEWAEFNRELNQRAAGDGSPEKLAMEFGDIVFTLANVARFAGFHPETALAAATRKFETRFNRMEKMAQDTHTPFEELSFEEKHRLWDLVKQMEDEE